MPSTRGHQAVCFPFARHFDSVEKRWEPLHLRLKQAVAHVDGAAHVASGAVVVVVVGVGAGVATIAGGGVNREGGFFA